VPEDKAGRIKAGSPVTVRGWANDAEFEGKVREVAASADAVTRTYTVKVTVDPQTAPALGATVYARPKALSSSGAPVLKVPTSALRQEGQGSAVWVLDKSTMTVRSQPVEVMTADGNEAVIARGLESGMLVVAAGVHVLQPGQKVTIYQDRSAAPMATEAKATAVRMPIAPVATR